MTGAAQRDTFIQLLDVRHSRSSRSFCCNHWLDKVSRLYELVNGRRLNHEAFPERGRAGPWTIKRTLTYVTPNFVLFLKYSERVPQGLTTARELLCQHAL